MLPKNENRDGKVKALNHYLAQLELAKAWSVEIKEHRARRSDGQNRLLWAIYEDILEKGGEEMGGWTKEDLHSFFLINHFGSDIRELFGKRRHVPLKRSAGLTKMEFTDFVESILRFMAERGVHIMIPEEFG